MHLLKFKKNLEAGKHIVLLSPAPRSPRPITKIHSTKPNDSRSSPNYRAQNPSTLTKKHGKKSGKQIYSSRATNKRNRISTSCLYHLYSFTREGTDYSLSPMGLSGFGYNGHVFWDADLLDVSRPCWYLHARDGRVHDRIPLTTPRTPSGKTLSTAIKAPCSPGKSAASGGEETPVWAPERTLRTSYHGRVGLAAWNYYCVTHDKTWLREKG